MCRIYIICILILNLSCVSGNGFSSLVPSPKLHVNAKLSSGNVASMFTDNLVVGGGLCGLTSAYYLHKHGRNVLLCDEGENLGGNIRSKRGIILD